MSEPDKRDRHEIIADLVETRKQLFDLRAELALNAGMLAKQCDLARAAETETVRLVAALELIAQQCEDHPTYMPDATDEDMAREGGDAATITFWAQTARAAVAKTSEPK